MRHMRGEGMVRSNTLLYFVQKGSWARWHGTGYGEWLEKWELAGIQGKSSSGT